MPLTTACVLVTVHHMDMEGKTGDYPKYQLGNVRPHFVDETYNVFLHAKKEAQAPISFWV
jgi:hypothetical protein